MTPFAPPQAPRDQYRRGGERDDHASRRTLRACPPRASEVAEGRRRSAAACRSDAAAAADRRSVRRNAEAAAACRRSEGGDPRSGRARRSGEAAARRIGAAGAHHNGRTAHGDRRARRSEEDARHNGRDRRPSSADSGRGRHIWVAGHGHSRQTAVAPAAAVVGRNRLHDLRRRQRGGRVTRLSAYTAPHPQPRRALLRASPASRSHRAACTGLSFPGELVVVEKHERLMLRLHLAERRAFGAEEEADGLLGNVEGRHVLALLELAELDLN
eukprot:CAMPEP_0119375046 /NCGR_PEP_ID=MMETSP1334-20130426/33487_1 /TAXON_ID=127549 /ORGANISM="Calcidiscus leptoporus, Strain RCC1130" /LENGTH=270 /DNA_ID=CAMNT_0007393247 /DNA_START=638 /DNA_END=1452 /DNA_ORIENTATION=+